MSTPGRPKSECRSAQHRGTPVNARRCPAQNRRQRGFTLVELLVAVAIGMALVLAITVMLVRYETGRRTLTSVNDASMGGAYVAYSLDRSLRSAGSGYVQSWRTTFGCRLLVSRALTTILPRAAAFPTPFGTVPTTARLAPVVVHAGAGAGGSDVLSVMTGSSGVGETQLPVLAGSVTATDLRVPTTVGLRADDLVLVYQDGAECMLQQVTNPFTGGATQPIAFGGNYADPEIESIRLQDIGASTLAWVSPLGNITANRPQFQLIGVGPNGTLVTYDMLQLDGTDTVLPIADGVGDLRALYGIDTTGDNRVNTWVSPAATGWTAADLLDGSAAAQLKLGQIVAVRVGVMVRTTSPERASVSPGSIRLFSDLGSTLEVTRTLSANEQKLHWQPLEFTVPLRNVLLKQ